MAELYNWKRFWCPRSGNISLADSGDLSTLEAGWGNTCGSKPIGLEAIADAPCLVLQGEPGLGKSYEMEQLRKYTENLLDEEDRILFVNLEYCSENKLDADLFKSKIFSDWMSGTHHLYLFLDSLDQGWLEIPNLPMLLVEKFTRLDKPLEKDIYKPLKKGVNLLHLFVALQTGFLQIVPKIKDRPILSRLHLRLACRTAVFPSTAGTDFKRLWGNALEICDLNPLCESDIRTALEAHNLDADTCLKEIREKGLMSLAIKPITLEFLLRKLRSSNELLLSNQQLTDLYLDGCRELCREPKDKNCHPSKPVSKLEPEQRLILTARVAAITTFCIRSTVWIGQDLGDENPNRDVLIRELCGQSESTNIEKGIQKVTASAVKEILDTALFSSRTANRMGWAHQTYAEFLAAWYLKRHNLNLEQILSLIFHPDGRVVPQLQQTVAWLASMMPEVFEEVMKIDPDVLLQSDVASRTEKDRSNLVDSLLRAYDEERLPYRFKQYQHLNHAEIGRQLRAYIRDLGKSESSRLVAIDIARDCHVEVVQDTLANITLDPIQPYIVRTHAAHAICAIGNEKTKERLKPLVLGQAGDDPNDDLKGYGLRAIWPQQLISVEDLLNDLSQPQQRGAIPIIGGVYQDFIAAEFAQHLLSCDLPVVLQWLEQLPKRYNLGYPFRELADSVMLKAWQNIDQLGVLEAFARVAKLKLERYEGILSDLPSQVYTAASSDHNHDAGIESFLKDSDEKRRQLIEAVVLLLPESTNDCSWLVHTILSQDVFWLIDNITSSKSTNIWIKLLSQALTWHNLRWKNVQINDAILQACSSTPLLQLEFEFDITPIELNSEKAKQFKADYLKYQNKLEQPKPKALLDPPPKQRVLAILEKIEGGYPELWWKVGMAMTLTPATIYWDNNAAFEPDLTKLFGWSDSDAETKLRILKTAKKYLDIVEPEISGLLKPRNLSNDNFAIYQAIYLLEKQETDFTSTIPRDTWGKLILIILESITFSYRSRREKDEYCQRIVRAAYKSNIDVFIGALASLMCQMNYQPRTHHMNDIYRFTSDLLNENISIPILRRVDSHNLKAGMLEVLLSDSFNQDIDKASARDIAISLIASPISKTGEARAKAIVAARMLLTHADNSGWSAFWSAMQQDLEFGREVLEAVSSESLHTGRIEQQLKEEFLADLYIFLVKQYPENSHSKPSAQKLSGVEAQILGEFDGVRMWKNYIPQRIQARGTQEACDALKKIIHELPTQKEKIQPLLLACEGQVRRSTWQWKTPEEFLHLVLTPEPTHSDLLKEIKKVAEEPKVINNIDASHSNNYAPIGTNGPTQSSVSVSPPDEKKGVNWGNWLALVGILVAIAAIPIGIFNPEINQQIKQWFNQSAPVKIEPQSNPPSK